MSAYTKGPWSVFEGTNRFGGCEVHEVHANPQSHFWVAKVLAGESGEANARLIAAAPELLEALIVARQNIQFLPPDGVLEQIDAALDKAGAQ
jgi:hypothetical protein